MKETFIEAAETADQERRKRRALITEAVQKPVRPLLDDGAPFATSTRQAACDAQKKEG